MNAGVGVIFPGQGSQNVGMGADIARRSPQAASIFDRAAAVLGYDLLALQSSGPEEKLRETQFSQPAIFVTNIAIYEAVGDSLQPVVSAGHSFGEICSLTIAGSLEFEDALRIVDERGKAMQSAADRAPGGMSAVLGLDAERIREVVARVREEKHTRLQLANFNSPTQIVISGDLAGVQAAGEAMLEAGAKRVVPLNVSGAWHSALMEPAIERFKRIVDAATFQLPQFTVISNVDAQPYESVDSIKRNLVRSITDEVRWHETAQRLLEHPLEMVIEFGANPVLAPLMKRLPNAPSVMNVSDYAGVEMLRGRLAKGDGVEV
ncbi:MAG: ACP S-malonyltransferase [Candidatus Eremiobacteraeota bacterium]|nr:ACP S-malonyltransferase [Candidatus Eremiobacteraeota bacterium]